MSVERLFSLLEDMKRQAGVKTVFGRAETIGERTVIPVAEVRYNFGLGFGQAPGEEQPQGEGGGGGGGISSRPVAVVEVTQDEVSVRPIIDENRLAMAGILLSGWAIFWIARTLIAIFGRSKGAEE